VEADVDATRFRRLRDAVEAALSQPPAQRDEELQRRCAGDQELLAEARALVALERDVGALTGAAAEQIRAAADVVLTADRGPETVGPYRILDQLGEGGMGVVYRAEQSGALVRTVALKLIRAGWSNPRVVSRFATERLALARMEHPNIACVFDAGTTADGRPWFAMELVDGEPLNTWCDARRLDLRDRVRLFVAVCRGVQHAHQKGIIHRDLKPTNVLVSGSSGEPVPKIIDFGIAKALAEPYAATAPATMAGQMLGTLEYLSPERIAGQDDGADTRADVYSLGVMLFELLSGRLPFDRSALGRLTPAAPGAATGAVDPPRLAAAVRADRRRTTQVAANRRTDAVTLQRRLRGDLDWIDARALAPRPEQRYATVQELQLDLERYLAGEAVVAGPPGALYRLRKAARRHRTALAVAAVVLVSLAGGLVESQRQRLFADAARNEAESVTEFLSSMLASVQPDEQGRDVTVLKVLDAAATSIATEFADAPAVRAQLQATIGSAYDALGDYEAAIAHRRDVVTTRRRLAGDRAVPTLNALRDLGGSLDKAGHYEEAIACFEAALAGLRSHGDAQRTAAAGAMNGLANVYALLGRYADAERLYLDALAVSRESLGETDALTVSLLNNLAMLRADQDRLYEAAAIAAQVLALRQQTDGPHHPRTMEAMINVAGLQSVRGEYDRAIATLEGLLPASRAALGDEHRITLTTLNNLGWACAQVGRVAEAESLTSRVLAIRTRKLGTDHVETLITAHNLANLYSQTGRRVEAEELHRRTLAARIRVLGADHAHTRFSREGLAAVLRAAGRDDEAAAVLAAAAADPAGPDRPR